MTRKSAFTLVELIIVIAVIGIIATIATLSFLPVQKTARDSQRSSKATTLAESLETYYSKNGEYPSPRSLLNTYSDNTADSVATKLSIDPLTIKMPQSPSNVMNSIGTAVSTTTIAYTASSDVNNTSCQTNINGGCDQFTLSYKDETNNTVVTIESRHKGRSAAFATAPEAPQTPTLNSVQSITTINAVASTTTCESGSLSAKYSFRERSNNGSWLSWGGWQTSTTYSRNGNVDGTLYGFQVKTRCDSSSIAGLESTQSIETTITYLTPLVAPNTPTMIAALVGGDANGSATTSCQSRSTLQYQIQTRTNTGSWTVGTWGSASSVSIDAPQPGVQYGFAAYARCVRGSDTQTSALSAEATYTQPINAPSAPSVTASTSGANTSYTWNATVCPVGTTARYQYKLIADWGYDSGWLGPYTAFTATSWGTTSQGYQYTVQVQSHCYTAYYTSAWSSSGQASYIRPVNGPSGISFGIRRDGPATLWLSATSSCGTGALLFSRSDLHTWDVPWTDSRALGWYADSHGGGWVNNTFNYYGNPFEVGTTRGTSGATFASGTRWNMAVDMLCKNTTTGRQSGNTGRIESGILYLP